MRCRSLSRAKHRVLDASQDCQQAGEVSTCQVSPPLLPHFQEAMLPDHCSPLRPLAFDSATPGLTFLVLAPAHHRLRSPLGLPALLSGIDREGQEPSRSSPTEDSSNGRVSAARANRSESPAPTGQLPRVLDGVVPVEPCVETVAVVDRKVRSECVHAAGRWVWAGCHRIRVRIVGGTPLAWRPRRPAPAGSELLQRVLPTI
jgi:hypothetical protein